MTSASSNSTPESQPAWKKLGLSLKRKHEDSCKDNKSSNKDQSQTESSKKPKRDKKNKKSKSVKKLESINNHWDYCDIYVNDKDQWKFSKQHQNWILKHVQLIPSDKKEVVFQYLQSVQGASKERLILEMKSVVDRWNEDNQKHEEETKAREERMNQSKDSQPQPQPQTPSTPNQKNKIKSQQKEIIGADYAILARELYQRLNGTRLSLWGVDETQLVEEDVEVENFVE